MLNRIRRSLPVFASSFVIVATAAAAAHCGSAGTSSTTSPTSPSTSTTTTTSYNGLFVPPLLAGTTASGVTTYDLTLAPSSKQLQTGAKTATYGYNGAEFWGPTLVLNKGDQARMIVRNSLTEATTTHWHGLLVPGPVDGGPHQLVAANSVWTTDSFQVKNNASTYWYHPHMHETTQKQLTLGAGGFIIIRDAEEAAFALPRTYGTDDIPLVLTSRRFTTTGGVANQFQTTTTAYGDYLLTNGVMNAAVTLPKQFVRLRLLNGEIERDYNVGFSDNRTFYVIGNDGGLLASPVSVTRLVMAPGERYEVLVNLGGDAVGSALDLMAWNGTDQGLQFGFGGYEPATSGEFGSLLNQKNFSLLRINVGAATSTGAITTLPTSLASLAGLSDLTQARATVSRTVSVTGGIPPPFSFDGRVFSASVINQIVALGSTEAWTINAGGVFSHSFHIHGVQFKLIARNGSAAQVKNYEQGWKDTIYMPYRETATFVARFDETADSSYPYMYHCHMSNHEDEGLMGQFTVR